MKIKDCVKCMDYLHGSMSFAMMEACASVGISNGKTTEEMIIIWISAYHNKGHKESR